jgi:UDPglucose--hexose-1-phosphate uridylyltransferase
MSEVYETENRGVGQWRRFQGTGRWVIMPSPERQKKPEAYLVREKQDFDEKKKRKENCPFCAGNLSKGLARIEKPEEPRGAIVEEGTGGIKWLGEKDLKLLSRRVDKHKWKTCVIRNLHPVLNWMAPATILHPRGDRPYIFADGLGICDIIIESQTHLKPLGVLDKDVCENVILTYLRRFNDLQEGYPNLGYISIFHNHRMEAGATIAHSHTQIFSTPFVPAHIENEISQARNYFAAVDIGKCPFCEMIKKEEQNDERVIRKNRSFIAITPFDSGSPFEIWILPIRHNLSFGNVNNPVKVGRIHEGINEDEIGDLADILTWVLGRLYVCVDDPGYNFVISTSPLHFEPDVGIYWHWHIRIETQRLDVPAGYEMASQVRVNKLPPESAAMFLKNMGNLFKQEEGNIFQRKPEDIENVLSIIKREFDGGLKLSDEQKNILRTAAEAFKFSGYYTQREKQKEAGELAIEEKTILERATSWAKMK